MHTRVFLYRVKHVKDGPKQMIFVPTMPHLLRMVLQDSDLRYAALRL